MPTNDECREVAARLRDYESLRESFRESPIYSFLDALGIEGYLDWKGVCNRLADLIEPEERTCRLVTHKRQVGGVVYERGDLYCSECNTLLWDSCGDPFYSLSKEEQNYCYNCGAKVVEE